MLSRHVNCEICAFKWTWQEEVRERSAEQRCPRESFVSTYGRRPQGYWYDKCLPEQMPRSHISIISWLYQNTIKSIQKYSTPVLLWESKLISSDVIKPFAARFANSKMVLHARFQPPNLWHLRLIAATKCKAGEAEASFESPNGGVMWTATKRGVVSSPCTGEGAGKWCPLGTEFTEKSRALICAVTLTKPTQLTPIGLSVWKMSDGGAPGESPRRQSWATAKWFANDERPLSNSRFRVPNSKRSTPPIATNFNCFSDIWTAGGVAGAPEEQSASWP